MWILVTAFCANFPSGDRCGSAIPPMFFPQEEMCISQTEGLMPIVRAETEGRGGSLFYFDAFCIEIERAEGTAL